MKILKHLLMLVLGIVVSVGGATFVEASTYLNTASGVEFSQVVEDFIVTPGETVKIKLPVKAIGNYINNPKIKVNTEDMPYSVSNITYDDGYGNSTGITTGSSSYIYFDLKLKETASIGKYKLNVSVEFYGYDGNTYEQVLVEKPLPVTYIQVDTEKEPAQLTVDNVSMKNGIRGSETTLTFLIKNEGELNTRNTYFSISGYEEAGIIPAYSKLNQEVGKDGILAPSGSYHVNLPIKVSTLATSGNKTLTVNFTYKDVDGKSYSDSSKVYVNIEENQQAPKIEIESVKFASELKAGDKFNLVVTLKNGGKTSANNIKVQIDGLGIHSFLEDYTSGYVGGKEIESSSKSDVRIPLIVSKEAASGLKKLDIKVAYTDKEGVEYLTTTSAYLDVTTAEGVTVDGRPNIIISNVGQSPNIPNAGARVDVSFNIENKSKVDISEVKVSVTNLSTNNFSPVNLEPYIYIEKVSGGQKSRVTIPLEISNTIPEGMSNLDVKLEYKDSSGREFTDMTTLYVLDIENNVGASKPKLLISNFSTDIEELRAGNVFTFNYEIKNTHSNIHANNIKITVSQNENIFSVTNGSNTSYVSRIPAGEVSQNSIELKVKSDAVTKAYPVDIMIEYEYDGAEVNPTTGQVGETVKETINLQAIENTRPVVDSVMLGYGDIPYVNQPSPLMFVFYNMGKSPLNNVRVTLEGDFTLSSGEMYFVGNVMSGSSEYIELEAIPSMEGMAKGNIVVTFEDSNGDEVSIKKEFESMTQTESIPVFNPDMGNGMEIPMEIPTKKAIVSLWLFIIIQVVIFVVSIFLVKKIAIQLHRRKLRKKEETETL